MFPFFREHLGLIYDASYVISFAGKRVLVSVGSQIKP